MQLFLFGLTKLGANRSINRNYYANFRLLNEKVHQTWAEGRVKGLTLARFYLQLDKLLSYQTVIALAS